MPGVAILLQLLQKPLVGDHIKGLTEVEDNDINMAAPFIHDTGPIVKGLH